MSGRDSSKALECRCTRCRYNSNGACGYQGRVLINANGECEVKQEGSGGGGGPFR